MLLKINNTILSYADWKRKTISGNYLISEAEKQNSIKKIDTVINEYFSGVYDIEYGYNSIDMCFKHLSEA